MKTVPTFWATIYVGRLNTKTGVLCEMSVIHQECHRFVDEVGLCVTVTPTEFIYTDGGEPGAIVGLINYPRFPADPCDIRHAAIGLAARLKYACCQLRVSVMMPDETVMLGGRGN